MNKNYSYLNKVFIMYVSPTTTKNWFHRQNFGIFLIVYTSPWLMLCITILTQSFAIYFWWSLKTKHRKEAWPVVVGYLHDHLQNYTSACLSCELCLALSSLGCMDLYFKFLITELFWSTKYMLSLQSILKSQRLTINLFAFMSILIHTAV